MLFFKVVAAVFIAEMGDKTQFLLIALASKYKIRNIIIGTGAAILVLNAIAVGLGSVISEFIPISAIKLLAGIAFFYFAWAAIKGDECDEDDMTCKTRKLNPIFSVFGTFFLAELGDKTQLTALAFSAESGIEGAISVYFACSIGLFAADMIGLFVGYMLKSKMPDRIMNILSFIVFAVFGIITLLEAFGMIFGETKLATVLLTAALSCIFAVMCVFRFMKISKIKR